MFNFDRFTGLESVLTRGHGGLIILKRLPKYWTFLRGNNGSLMDSPHKGWVIRGFGVFCEEQAVKLSVELFVISNAIALM